MIADVSIITQVEIQPELGGKIDYLAYFSLVLKGLYYQKEKVYRSLKDWLAYWMYHGMAVQIYRLQLLSIV